MFVPPPPDISSKADASVVSALQQAIPTPATTAPPPVTTDSAKGDIPRFALENHTHQSGAAFYYDASLVQGSITNTKCTICIRKTPRTLTVSVLGAVLSLFSNPADTVWINIMSRAPS